jgi:cation diffusion facilitator CzcD-associated flavoprotein CzcO
MATAVDHDRVCIIGAGSSGLVSAKVLHGRGIPFDCIERGSAVGGMWRYENDSGLSSAYRSLHINTSRDRMCFSDFPMPDSYPDFPHHAQIVDYFDRYVDHFGFRDQIRFRTTVERVVPRGDGRFDVTLAPRERDATTRAYRAVLVANGHHWSPRWPDFPGHFGGPSLHSHHYREPQALRGKRVLVVGMGNSGCDIVCEAARVAETAMLSTRRGAHVIPKYVLGRPLDCVLPPVCWRYLPFRVLQGLAGLGVRLSRGRLTRYGLPAPAHRLLEEHPTISADLLNLLGHGAIRVKPDVAELLGERVRFVDGSEEPVDVIIYATGYNISFPFLDPTVVDVSNNEVHLYRNVVHPRVANLFFIGLVQPWGAIMPLAEAQSEWVADLLEGRAGLLSLREMEEAIQRERARSARRYTQSARHTIQVDFYRYYDQVHAERRRRPSRGLSRGRRPRAA